MTLDPSPSDLLLETRPDGEKVIDRLYEILAQHGRATVADLYELVGLTGHVVDNTWGWTDLTGTGLKRVEDGYLLDLPRPKPLN